MTIQDMMKRFGADPRPPRWLDKLRANAARPRTVTVVVPAEMLNKEVRHASH